MITRAHIPAGQTVGAWRDDRRAVVLQARATGQALTRVTPARPSPPLTARQRLRGHPYAIGGYACLFNREAVRLGVREVVRPGAFARALAAGGWFVLVDHKASAAHDRPWMSPIRVVNPSRVLASTDAGTLYAEEDPIGLWCELALPADARGRAVIDQLRRGQIRGLSIGSTSATGANVGGVRVLDQLSAWDISLCIDDAPGRPGTWVALLGEADRTRRGLLNERRTA